MRLLLQRYLAASYVLPLMVSLIFFICFLLTFELFKFTELLVTRDVSWRFMLAMLGNLALTFIPLAMPIALFFSTIYCVNRLCGDSEYIAMRAGGMTKGKILLPFLLVGFTVMVSVYQMNQNVIPRSIKDFKKRLNYLASSGVLAGIKPGQFFNTIPDVTLFASEATQYGRKLGQVFLYLNEPRKKSDKIIFAEKGELILERDKSELIEKLTLKLENGNILSRNKNNLEKILFKEYLFPISQNQIDNKVSLKETMLTSSELETVFKMSKEEAWNIYRFNEKDLFNARYEYWNRKNNALICFILCFLGFSIGVRGNRGKSGNSGLMGVVCLILYYGMYFSLVGFAKKGIIPVQVTVFLPATVLILIALRFYRRLDWQA